MTSTSDDNNDPDDLKGLKANPFNYAAQYIKFGFIGVGHLLQVVLDDDPTEFSEACQLVGVSKRTGYALAKIERRLSTHVKEIPRLHAIGWSKLQVIAPHATPENREELLQLAEKHTVHELELLMKDLPVLPDGRTMLLHFTASQYMAFQAAVLAHGATKSGKGLAHVEEALIAALQDGKA